MFIHHVSTSELKSSVPAARLLRRLCVNRRMWETSLDRLHGGLLGQWLIELISKTWEDKKEGQNED